MALELGREAGVGSEQQGLLAVDHAGVQVRHGHWRGADLGLAVDLGLMLGDHFGVVAAQPLAADREAAEALAFRNAGHLQQRQRAAAGTEEDEARADLAHLAILGVLHLGQPGVAGALQADDFLEVAHFAVGLALQVRQQLDGQCAEVDVGTVLDAGCGDLLVGRAAGSGQRHPLTELGLVFGVDHGLEGVVLAEGFEALAQERHVLAAHEAQVRNRIDEGARRAEVRLADQVCPELLGHLELGVDIHGLLDVDRTVGGLRGVVQLAQAGMAGTRVVPGVGTFHGAGFLQLDDLQLQAGVELFEQDGQGCAHDACAYQQDIQAFVFVLRH
ncbi:MAG: hypothetical protein GAK34_00032 [Delftia tsuruhatensis]|nr:MAG: hypothetical protein GAK34_00032 [Delftia tsuruhatensis]